MRSNGILLFALTFGSAATLAFSANLPVGVASSISTYSVNNATVTGTTNLAEGSELRTSKSPGEVVLQNGAAVRLANKSAGTIYKDRMVLQDGTVKITNFDGYPVQVRSLQINADAQDSQATIKAKGNTIEVASVGSGVRVMTGTSLLTRVGAGTRISFKPNKAPDNNSFSPQLPSDTHVLYWFIGAIAGAAIIIGSIAIAQGKGL